MAKAISLPLALVELYSPKDSLLHSSVKHTDEELILHNAVTLRYDSSHGNLHLCGVSSYYLPDEISHFLRSLPILTSLKKTSATGKKSLWKTLIPS